MYRCDDCGEYFTEEEMKIEFNYVGTYGGCECLASSPCCDSGYVEIQIERFKEDIQEGFK